MDDPKERRQPEYPDDDQPEPMQIITPTTLYFFGGMLIVALVSLLIGYM